MYVKWKLVLVYLQIVLLSVQDRCMAWKSFWTHLMVLLGDMGQVEARFGPFGDSVIVDAREVHGLRRMYVSSGSSFRTIWR
jgi:hypothetical protein